MVRRGFVGASAAAALPAALAAAVLVSAPFAGTTTEPLAHTKHHHARHHHARHHAHHTGAERRSLPQRRP